MCQLHISCIVFINVLELLPILFYNAIYVALGLNGCNYIKTKIMDTSCNNTLNFPKKSILCSSCKYEEVLIIAAANAGLILIVILQSTYIVVVLYYKRFSLNKDKSLICQYKISLYCLWWFKNLTLYIVIIPLTIIDTKSFISNYNSVANVPIHEQFTLFMILMGLLLLILSTANLFYNFIFLLKMTKMCCYRRRGSLYDVPAIPIFNN